MNRPLCLLATLCLVLLPGAEAQVLIRHGEGWAIDGTDPIRISFLGKPVTSYNAGLAEGKPYFYPIFGPSGENMTRHWPMSEDYDDEERDHIHHRGMWYGLGKVNGFDFWHFEGDESKKDHVFGVIRHRGMNGVMIKGETITFRTRSDWLEAANLERRICSDQREFTLFFRDDGSLVIDATISLNADAGDLTIGDDKEGAWAIRTIPTLRLKGDVAKGHMINSNGLEDAGVWGKRAAWVDYYGPDRAGNPVGIAILDHPGNLRHPTWWHAREYGLFAANPFGEGSFDKDAVEGAGNYLLPNGESLLFRYRTIFHRGDAAAAGIAEAYEMFATE